MNLKSTLCLITASLTLLSPLVLVSCASSPPASSSSTPSFRSSRSDPSPHPLSQDPSASLGGPESVASFSRSQPVVSTRGMVVSDDPIASEWGAELLRQGGNAMDAAVGTAFMLSVTRPHYAALGGGGFMIYCPHPSQGGTRPPCAALDFRETAPQAAHPELFIRNGKLNTHLAQNGALASATPGIPAGLLTSLKRFGTLSRQKILSQPIQVAQNGFRFTFHEEVAAYKRWHAMNPAAKKIFGCPDQLPCPPGTVIQQKDLAKVLQSLSREGSRGFYEGEVAQKIIQGIRSAGGILSLKDLKEYEPKWRTPMVTPFKDQEIISMPPPSSGGVILAQLLKYAALAEQQGQFQSGFGSTASLHAFIHSMSLAFADRAHFLGDPDFVSTHWEHLIEDSYLKNRWKTFNPKKAKLPQHAGEIEQAEPQHTTHLSVMDRLGNAVSMTLTVNNNYGSGFVPPGTGIVMNDEMDDFSANPGAPNQFGLIGEQANRIESKKRPLSSMTPTIVRDEQGEVRIIIGGAGGPRIVTSVFLSLMNRMIFGMSIQDALAAPRIHHQWIPKKVDFERFGFAHEIKQALHQKGYEMNEVTSLAKVHALERLKNGRITGAADPRGEGASASE